MSARICYPGGPLIECTKTKDGSIRTNSFNAPLHAAELAIHSLITNSSEVRCVSLIADCIQSMKDNLSDYSVGEYVYYPENDVYYVPVAWDPGSVYIVSGYDVNAYEKQTKGNSSDVLRNVSLFAEEIYLVIALLCASFLVIFLLKAYLLQKRYQVVTGRPGKYSLFVKRLLLELRSHSRRDMKAFCLSLTLSFFLISTPFLLMFKTAQVVVQMPNVLSIYESVMRANATVYYSNMLSDERKFIEPGPNAKKDSITYRFWHYYLKKSKFYDMGSTSKNKNVKAFRALANEVCNGEGIFLSTYAIAARIRQVFCTFSEEHQIFNTFVNKDPNQREELNGFAMRVGYEDKKLIRKQRQVFEFHYLPHMRGSFRNYFMLQLLGTSEEHQKLQKRVCEDRKIIHKLIESKASGTEFFMNFSFLLLSVVAFSFIILIIEIALGK